MRSFPPPDDAKTMNFAQLLRLAMDYGIGKRLEPNNDFAKWTEMDLISAFTTEFERRFGEIEDGKSKASTIGGWLHYGKRPEPDNLTVLIFVLTKGEKIDHSEEWRKLFLEKAREKLAPPPQPEDTAVDLFPRGECKDQEIDGFKNFLSKTWSGASLDRMVEHLSLDYALDVFEKSAWRDTPIDASPEEALHTLIIRAFLTAQFESQLGVFLSQNEVTGLHDEWPSIRALSRLISTTSKPFRFEDLLAPEKHQSFQISFRMAGHGAEKEFAALYREAFHRQFFLNLGRFWGALSQAWPELEENSSNSWRLQLLLHQAGLRYEVRRSLFSTRSADTGEPLSLSDIYVDLPCTSLAAWEENSRAFDDQIEFKDTRHLVEGFCQSNWHGTAVADQVLVLRGDPGTGKSSILKMISSRAGAFNDCEETAVLFVPFQKGVDFSTATSLLLKSASLVGFRHSSSLLDVIELVQRAGFRKLLVFFDGLDELGNVASHETQVRQFSRILAQLIEPSNTLRCKFVISGRDQAFRPTEFEIDLLDSSYRLVGLAQNRVELYRHDAVIEDQDISTYFDLRPIWLEKYCKYKSLFGNVVNGQQLSESFESLGELTKEPLLLFLLSRLTFVMANRRKNVGFPLGGVFDLSNPKGLTKADIYSLLIASIRIPQHRNHSEMERPFREGGLPDGKDFEEVLSCMAVPVWHSGTGRRGTIGQFFEYAESRGVLEKARRFTTAAREEDARLIDPEHLSLMSVFYFDAFQGDGQEGDEYEFTHKSFASYLTARVIFSSAVELAWAFQHTDVGKRDAALGKWLDLTVYGFEEPEILSFLNLEIDRYNFQEGAIFLNDLGVIGQTAKMIRSRDVTVDADDFKEPFEFLFKNAASLTASVQGVPSRLAVQRVLVVLFAVWTAFIRGTQRNSDESYDLELEEPERVFRELASPIDANELDALYNVEAETSYLSECMSSLNLSGHDLSGLNLINGRFRDSNLEGVHCQLSVMDWSEFENCRAEGLSFISTQLQHARFFRCDQFTLVNSVMRHALVEYCKFDRVFLDKTELTATRFLNCRFTACQLEFISFQDCDIQQCVFQNCSFKLCNFDEASFESVEFRDCTFELCSQEGTAFNANVTIDGQRENSFPH